MHPFTAVIRKNSHEELPIIKGSRGYDDEDLEKFQKRLNVKFIHDLWKELKDNGNPKEGRVIRTNFKEVFHRVVKDPSQPKKNNDDDVKDALLDDIFNRFKYTNRISGIQDSKVDSKKEEIDISDLVISLAVLSGIDYDDKLKLIFDLKDVDEDGVLSKEEIFQLILCIERNFAVEVTHIDPISNVLLQDIATRKAKRRYKYIFSTKKIEEKKNENENGKGNDLKDYKDFVNDLEKREMFKKLLPNTFPLKTVLENVREEVKIDIKDRDKIEEFTKFRENIHKILWQTDEVLQENFSKKYQSSLQVPGVLPNLRERKDNTIAISKLAVSTIKGMQAKGIKDSKVEIEGKDAKIEKNGLSASKTKVKDDDIEKSGFQGISTMQDKLNFKRHELRLIDMKSQKEALPKIEISLKYQASALKKKQDQEQ